MAEKQENFMENVISRETLVPLGTAVAIIASLFLAYQSLQVRLTTMENKIDHIQRSLDDQWTITDMIIYSQKFQIANPEIKMPDILAIVSHKQERR